MPEVRTPVRDRGKFPGGIISYPLDLIYEEVAFIAYHFHWSFEEIIHMEHGERKKWCEEISSINRQRSGEKQKSILEM